MSVGISNTGVRATQNQENRARRFDQVGQSYHNDTASSTLFDFLWNVAQSIYNAVSAFRAVEDAYDYARRAWENGKTVFQILRDFLSR